MKGWLFGPTPPDQYWKNSLTIFVSASQKALIQYFGSISYLASSPGRSHIFNVLILFTSLTSIFHFQFQSSGSHQSSEDTAEDSQLRMPEEDIRGEQVGWGEQEVRYKGTAGGEISHAPEGCDRVPRSKLSRGHQECYQCSSVCLLER